MARRTGVTARKTVSVEFLKDTVNATLKAPRSTLEQREAVSDLLEYVLHETGNYRGFRYLVPWELAEGVTPGIRRHENGTFHFEDTDATRRAYT